MALVLFQSFQIGQSPDYWFQKRRDDNIHNHEVLLMYMYNMLSTCMLTSYDVDDYCSTHVLGCFLACSLEYCIFSVHNITCRIKEIRCCRYYTTTTTTTTERDMVQLQTHNVPGVYPSNASSIVHTKNIYILRRRI